MWLSENGMGELGGKKFAAVRSHLMDCVDHKTEIEEWRKALPLHERIAWNHPTTVWRQFNKHLAAEAEEARLAAGGEELPKKPSPMAKANEAIRNLVDENDRLRKAPREGDLFKWSEDPKRIARVIVTDALASGCSPDKVEKVLRAALAALGKVEFVPKAKPAKKSTASLTTEDVDRLVEIVRASGNAGVLASQLSSVHGFYGNTINAAKEAGLVRDELRDRTHWCVAV